MVHTVAAVVIFVLTYALVSARRLQWLPLGRPGAALAGAVAMVLIAGLPPEEAYAAISSDTLALLLGMMGITAYLARAGFFDGAADALVRGAGTPLRLLLGTGLLAGVASAILVNDAVCLFLAPVVITACVRGRLPLAPYLLAVATCSNTGSVATLVGNPQCMLLGGLGDLQFASYAATMAPVAAVALAVNLALLALFFGRVVGTDLPKPEASAPPRRGPLVRGLTVVALVVAGFFSGLSMGWCALGGFAALILVEREDPAPVLRSLDWGVLLFFAGLFVVVRGLAATGLPDAWWDRLPPPDIDTFGGRAALSGALAAGSNLVSNVPVVLLAAPRLEALGEGDRGWHLAAMATTFAGNLTLLGSVANIIVAEAAKEHHELGFWEYLKFGVPCAVATLLVGVLLL
jgi:Na+/H+ antiporter NhaD/arsenite permease-like protein